MKELSTEEKAKRYEEVLAMAKEYVTYIPGDVANYIFNMFPELKESTDEGIRESIAGFLKTISSLKDGQTVSNEDFDTKVILEWVAWLKKQGKQSSNIFWHDVSEEPDANREIFCEWKSSTGTWHSIVFYHAYSKTFCEGGRIIKNVLKWTYVNEMLEKQGEQKPVDKVEPKFKIGDWIVYNRTDHSREVMQIYDIRDNRYYFNDNAHFSWSVKECDGKSHLWTIEDAKKGDVLAGKIDGDSYILIYKQIKDGWIETYGHYYDSVDRFCVPSQLFCREVKGTFRPTTKEQKEFLFQKMRKAGYEWDKDKKELIKL